MQLEVIVRNGALVPRHPAELVEGQSYLVTIADSAEAPKAPSVKEEIADPVAWMEARFPDAFGALPDAAAREMREAIDSEFERIDETFWQ